MKDLLREFGQFQVTSRRAIGDWVKTASFTDLLRVAGFIQNLAPRPAKRQPPKKKAAVQAPPRRKLSRAARKAISAAQKKRWKNHRRKNGKRPSKNGRKK